MENEPATHDGTLENTRRPAIGDAFWRGCGYLNAHCSEHPFNSTKRTMAGFWREALLAGFSTRIWIFVKPPQVSLAAPRWQPSRAGVQMWRVSGRDGLWVSEALRWDSLHCLERRGCRKLLPLSIKGTSLTFTIWRVLMHHACKPSWGLNVTYMLTTQATPRRHGSEDDLQFLGKLFLF